MEDDGQQGLDLGLAAATHDNRSARPSKQDPFTPLIDEILLIDLDATRKQRHTVTPDLPPSDRRALLVRGAA
ncbi:hypothetical protein [Streptomyces sp. MAI_2237]